MAWSNARTPKQAAASAKKSVTMRNKIRSYVKEKSITLKVFAELIGSNPTTLGRFLSGKLILLYIYFFIIILLLFKCFQEKCVQVEQSLLLI